ncbi:12357_t:CDS:2 [Gigaspora margarita]|uniref:12357_t:CDS:1 n=1 Tax=Gigaspora margarita TaxID=4874 RepID=A0ABN7UDB1_GIGMA|nr:12357_t:CDS:2 [Gigaspora margarita]
MTRYPTIKGVLYELHKVIEMSDQVFVQFTSCKTPLHYVNAHDYILHYFYECDFFINPPLSADIYFLHSVLHNWPDEQVIKILKTAHSAIPLTDANSETTSYFKSKLLIADRVIYDESPSHIYQLDLIMMMYMCNSKQRTKSEKDEL